MVPALCLFGVGGSILVFSCTEAELRCCGFPCWLGERGGDLGPVLHMLVSHVSPLLPELDSECYSRPELPAPRTGQGFCSLPLVMGGAGTFTRLDCDALPCPQTGP